MALADHERQLQRSAEAERRRDAHDKAAAGGGDPFAAPADEKGGAPAAALRDLSLKDKITVSVPVRSGVRAIRTSRLTRACALRRSSRMQRRRQEERRLTRLRHRRRRG
jgi:hypothetical protein